MQMAWICDKRSGRMIAFSALWIAFPFWLLTGAVFGLAIYGAVVLIGKLK